MADSYGDPMLGGVQTQSIDRVSFEETEHAGLLVRVYARHGRISLRSEYPKERLPKPKVSNDEIDFRLDGNTFKVTPETAAAARETGTATNFPFQTRFIVPPSTSPDGWPELRLPPAARFVRTRRAIGARSSPTMGSATG